MWRKQEAPKSPSSATEVVAGSALGESKTPASAPAVVNTPSTPPQTPTPNKVAAAVPPPPASPSAPVPRAALPASHLTGALKIKGEITGKEDLLIDAQLDGQVRLDGGTVTVGPNGRVTANVETNEIVVSGQVKGSLRGRERVRIAPTGRVSGEIISRRVSIEAGAEVNGRVEVTRAAEAPALRAVAAAGAQASAPRVVQSAQPPAKGPSAAA